MNKIFSLASILLLVLFCASCGKKYKSLSTQELLSQSLATSTEGKWKDAEEMAACVLQREPDNVHALIIEGLALDADSKRELAIGYLEKAVNKAPDNFMANHSLGRLFLAQKKYEQALPYLKKAFELNPAEMNTVIMLAEAMNKLKMSGASSYYACALRNPRFKNDPAPWNQLGVIFAGTNSKNKALDFFVKAYKADQSNHVVVLNLAIFLDRYMNSSSKSKPFYDKYLKLTDKNQALDMKRSEVKKRIKEIDGNS